MRETILKKSELKFLTEDEKKELFFNINQDQSRYAVRNRAIFYLAKYCALRASEISLLRLNDYIPTQGKIFCHRLKGSKNNTLQIVDPVVLEHLNTYYSKRIKSYFTSDALFISQLGKPLSRKMLDVLIKNYCVGTTIPSDKRHFHVLKHTRAMELIEYPSVKLTDVQWWLGHKNIANTMKYLDYTPNAMKELFKQISLYESEQIQEEPYNEQKKEKTK